ncbi:MAG: hypothetical protein KF893_17065 [Caldilineaceae bacterium]|nr:hypothetical protein [Caldilineaceae bacterium]
MLPFIAVAVARTTSRSPWTPSLYAGLFTAVAALIYVLVVGMPIVPAIIGLLIGAAPVLAYQYSRGVLGSDWRPVIGGIVGFVLFLAAIFLPAPAVGWVTLVLALLSMIIWPIVVGAMTPEQSIGRLLLASLLGFILGLAIAFVVGLLMGQNPNTWPGLAGVLFFSFWGGTVGAAMTAWSK